MTPTLRIILIGGTVTAVAKMKFGQAWPIAIIAGLGAVILWDMAIDKD